MKYTPVVVGTLVGLAHGQGEIQTKAKGVWVRWGALLGGFALEMADKGTPNVNYGLMTAGAALIGGEGSTALTSGGHVGWGANRVPGRHLHASGQASCSSCGGGARAAAANLPAPQQEPVAGSQMRDPRQSPVTIAG